MGLAAISGFVAGTVSVVGLIFLGPFSGSAGDRFWPSRIFRHDPPGPQSGDIVDRKISDQGDIEHAVGSGDIRWERTSCQDRKTDLWAAGAPGRHRFCHRDGGTIRPGRGLPQCRETGKIQSHRRAQTALRIAPDRREIIQCIGTWTRSSIIGFLIGALPGTGATVASFLSYSVAKNSRRRRNNLEMVRWKGLRRLSPRTMRQRADQWPPCSPWEYPGPLRRR